MTTMMEEIQESTVVEDTNDEDDEDHLACLCSPRLSFCGILLNGDGVSSYESDDPLCKDCKEMDQDPCPRCGD